ncbi:caspase domain-containing protein [Kitasatospora sp. MY 5-36]|uniref:caspase family protein n=1 Tax=Kitasatospora sp. MY 5-36 TaxID=1678027 RepID=UPI0006715B49|nr:caspase family protein [Kitasatospora sp. MY 5-36]
MHYLIAAGTSSYGADEFPRLPCALNDVERVAEFLTAPAMGYTRVLGEVSRDPVSTEFEDALSDWCASGRLTTEDVVVVYYAGHGDQSVPGAPYRLACADTRLSRPRSWLSPQNMAEVLAASPLRNVLFVIDSCHAAIGSTEIQAVTDGIAASRRRGDDSGAGTWVLASARHRDLADDGGFVPRFIEVCATGDGPSQRYLSPSTVAAKVNQAFTAEGRRQRVACSSNHQSAQPPFFPNPGYDASAEVGEREVAADASDLSSHFEPRGRGVEHVHDPGSYFTGRRKALGRLRDTMAGPGRRGALVVTAAPGSGKSAVLGRLVLEGYSDVSVNARHQSLEALVARLAAAADVRATDPAALLTALAKRKAPLRIVIDSLDEAGPAGDRTEARRIAWDLLRPLGAVPCVRLVVGSRWELLPHIGEQVSAIDLDSSEYADDTSTAEYVRRILGDAGSPYSGLEEQIAAIAAEVARRARHCFLVARMTASALLCGDVLDTTVPGWAESLPSDVGGAFEAYLRRVPHHRAEAVMALLTALAFGEGNGLPRRIWLLVASRLSGIALREADIDALVEEDGSYLAWAEVSRTKHFRLYHQELTDYLRQRTLKVRDLQDVQEGFVEVLLDLTPGRRWEQALPYIRQHLATHAAAAGSIQELVEDPSFILATDPTELLPAVRHTSCDPVLAMVVERFVGLPAPSGLDRAALLAFTAESHGAAVFARRAEGLSSSVQRIRVEARTVTPHRIVGRHHDGTYSTTSVVGRWYFDDLVLPNRNRAVLALASGRPEVYVWMIDTPALSTTLMHSSRVTHVRALPSTSDHALAVTLDALGDLRVWNISDQDVVHHIQEAHYRTILDVGELDDGTPVVVCHSQDRITIIDSAGKTLLEAPADPTATAALVRYSDDTTHLVICDSGSGEVTEFSAADNWAKTILVDGLIGASIFDHPSRELGSPLIALWEPEEEVSGRILLLDCENAQICTAIRLLDHPRNGSFIRHGLQHVAFVVESLGFIATYSSATGLTEKTRTHATMNHLFLPFTLAGDSRVRAARASLDSDVDIIDCTTGSSTGYTLCGHESAASGLHMLAQSDICSRDILTVSNDGTARLWNVRFDGRLPADSIENHEERRHDKSTTVLIHSWSVRSQDFIVGSWVGLRLVSSTSLDQGSDTYEPLIAHNLPEVNALGFDVHAEDKNGNFHLLSRRSGERRGNNLTTGFSWHQLTIDGSIVNSPVSVPADTPWGTECHLIPPIAEHSEVRMVGFDSENGRIFYSTSPGETIVTDSPWKVDTESTAAFTAGFTIASGDTVLFIAIAKESPQRDFSTTGYGTFAGASDSDSLVHIYLWNATTRQPINDKLIALPTTPASLAPHHDAAGTRYIAIATTDNHVMVLDLENNRFHTVYPPQPKVGISELRTLANDCSYYLRWADTKSGDPALVYMPGLGHDDTDLSPVVVWDSTHPAVAARELPIRARRLLWTGAAPSGDALLAISDEFGIRLFSLPDAEEVWSTPLPALITSLAARPHSPHLDLGVATQQGVVLIRPRLTPYWKRRLLQKP